MLTYTTCIYPDPNLVFKRPCPFAYYARTEHTVTAMSVCYADSGRECSSPPGVLGPNVHGRRCSSCVEDLARYQERILAGWRDCPNPGACPIHRVDLPKRYDVGSGGLP